MNFDQFIERRGTLSQKWDDMERYTGVPAESGLAMWVADMEFRPPHSVQRALETLVQHGVYGYMGGDAAYMESIQWWLHTRHGWTVAADAIFTTSGVVNAVALCIDTFTSPGDGVVLMTPVYHAFARVIQSADRHIVECPLRLEGGRLMPDFAAWDAQMTGTEKMLILCSPHNPGGRVWTPEELRGIADFCQRHDLLLVSDEIHFDLVYPGFRHTMTALAAPAITQRLITLTAVTKTFNLAALHTGFAIIEDPALKQRFAQRLKALAISGNGFGNHLVPGAYSPEGAAWVDALMQYLEGNRQLFDEGVNSIAGLQSVRLEATYLAWVDFSGTGLNTEQFAHMVANEAGIATNLGPTFGAGGENFLRFNIGAPRSLIKEAVARLQGVFGRR
jgi:cystathionine beta-lyase